MQLRGLLAAVAVLAVLGGVVFWSSKTKKDDEKKADTPKLLSVAEDQIQQIDIAKRDAPVTTLKKADKWQIIAPEALNADQEAINSLAGSAASLTSERVVEETAADLSPFGLTQPSLQVTVTQKDGKKVKLQIGDETPGGSGFYAKLDGQPKVYTIGSFNKTALDKTAQDLRDKRLVTFDSEKVSRLELNAKNQTIEFGKNAQNEWQLVKPKPLRADNLAVEEAVRKIKDAKMDTAASEEDKMKAAQAFLSGTKVAVARVFDAAGTHTIEVRKKDKDYFAKGSAVDGVFKVANELGEGLDKAIDDFRNKKLFDFGFNEPSKIEAISGGQTKTYIKQGEKWKLGAEDMDSVSIQSFVDKVRDLASIKFVESGFTKPIFEVKLTAKDGKLNEHVQISQTGNSYFAVRAGEPSVYELDGKAVEELQKAAADVKPPAPPSAGKDEKKK